MRGNISKLDTLGRETLDLEESRAILEIVEKHREQLSACQRQFRLANVKVTLLTKQLWSCQCYVCRLLPDVDPHLQVLKLSGAEVSLPARWSHGGTRAKAEIFRESLRELT